MNIAELKNPLSTYITYAKAGETIVIRDQDKDVAQLAPLAADPQPDPSVWDAASEEERELVALGIMRLGSRPWDPRALDRLPWPKVEGNAGVQAIIDDRNESM